MSELDASNGSLAYARMPPICASASRMSTPGMMGRAGKCPWNQGSPIVTHLWPTMRSRGTTSVTRSTSTNGHRCGRICRMRSISIVVGSFTVRARSSSAPRAAVELREGAQPPRARHGRVSCHDRPRRYIADDAALGGDARAVAHGHVVGDAGLAADEDAPAERDRAGEPALRRDDAALADVAVVADVDVGVELRPGADAGRARASPRRSCRAARSRRRPR